VALALIAAAHGGAVPPQGQQGAKAPKQGQTAKQVHDPVCGMAIDPAKAAGKSEYKGATYFFCSAQCKRTFDADPEAVLRKAAQKK